ncbi:MAG: hypothetical protein M1825_006064 [Sarcosagium campestre]|nr:MAG: hypothetical protein M1825_006064 [Sarcosagium campestre]
MISKTPIQGSDLQFDNIEDTIKAFKTGSFIIVLDSPGRENEGDLIISASSITTAQAAFMIHHTSGLLCTPLRASLAQRLGLEPMVSSSANRDPNRTAYTVSVDAASPLVSTGISAHDRALTARVLAGKTVKAEQLRSPGHVLPLIARDGGVRERAGHTEAALDFCRLAGLPEVAVIAELVQSGDGDGDGDGEVVEERDGPRTAEREGGDGMMRAEECLRFAKTWGLRCCTIEALVDYLETASSTTSNGVRV